MNYIILIYNSVIKDLQPQLNDSICVPLSTAVQEYRAILYKIEHLTMLDGLEQDRKLCIACPRVNIIIFLIFYLNIQYNFNVIY